MNLTSTVRPTRAFLIDGTWDLAVTYFARFILLWRHHQRRRTLRRWIAFLTVAARVLRSSSGRKVRATVRTAKSFRNPFRRSSTSTVRRYTRENMTGSESAKKSRARHLGWRLNSQFQSVDKHRYKTLDLCLYRKKRVFAWPLDYFGSVTRSFEPARHSIRCKQSSVTMRLCSGLSRAELALLARPRSTRGASDGLYLLESGLLGLHGCL